MCRTQRREREVYALRAGELLPRDCRTKRRRDPAVGWAARRPCTARSSRSAARSRVPSTSTQKENGVTKVYKKEKDLGSKFQINLFIPKHSFDFFSFFGNVISTSLKVFSSSLLFLKGVHVKTKLNKSDNSVVLIKFYYYNSLIR